MAHAHTHEPAGYDRSFALGILLNVTFILVEILFGLRADSLSLVADAGHNASDVLSLLAAWGATAIAQRKPTARRTYGYRRTTILASLFNALLLLVAVGAVAWEAIQRLSHPTPVVPWTVVGVAAIGVLVNAGTAMLFFRGRKNDLNIRGAFLHMAADAGVSGAVVIAGLFMTLNPSGLSWLDPMVTLLIVAVITTGTWSLLRDSLDLALDAVPKEIDPGEVNAYLLGLPGTQSVHDLHIWAMSTTEIALTVHLVMPLEHYVTEGEFLDTASKGLRERFGIAHATLQIEPGAQNGSCSDMHV